MKISIIIPAHNEEGVIAHTIKSIKGKLNSDYEIIVVNDHSSDNTANIITGLLKQYTNLRLVDNDTEKGFANALKKGFSAAGSDLIIPVMADLCDDPDTINDMYLKAVRGFDIVSGSRYMKGGKKIGGPLIQDLCSRFVGCTLKCLTGIPTLDVSNSFKCYRRKVLNAVKLESKGFEISMEIALKAYFAGFSITEVPTTWRGRFIGKSKFYILKAAPAYIKLYLWAILRKARLKWQR